MRVKLGTLKKLIREEIDGMSSRNDGGIFFIVEMMNSFNDNAADEDEFFNFPRIVYNAKQKFGSLEDAVAHAEQKVRELDPTLANKTIVPDTIMFNRPSIDKNFRKNMIRNMPNDELYYAAEEGAFIGQTVMVYNVGDSDNYDVYERPRMLVVVTACTRPL